MADTLVSIGDFSRMTYLTVKALRYYHDAGILAPWSIDPASGYRSYHVSQVPLAQVIRRLRDLDMPLDDVRTVVNAPDVDTRNRAITEHLKRMEEQLSQTRATVSSLRTLLQTPGSRPSDVTFRTVDAQWTLAVRGHVALAESSEWAGLAFGELYAALDGLGARRVEVDGALFYNDLFEKVEGELVAFIPVDRETTVPSTRYGRVFAYEIPEAELAVMVHTGCGTDIDQTYGALGSFVAERAIGVAGPIRENFRVGAADVVDESQQRTEVCWPVFRTGS